MYKKISGNTVKSSAYEKYRTNAKRSVYGKTAGKKLLTDCAVCSGCGQLKYLKFTGKVEGERNLHCNIDK
jgi:hypothetical protein